jgi:hypothetical protein
MKTMMNIIYPAVALSALACLALAPSAQAQLSPPPDGGYPNANTAEGEDALFSLTTGTANTAIGFEALYNNTTGTVNTATGANALLSNTTGSDNVANGFAALFSNIEGFANVATGNYALFSNTTGQNNTAVGWAALYSNDTGSSNTANGSGALNSNTTGSGHTAIGSEALYNNTSDNPDFPNTAIGSQALYSNTTGTGNTATGHNALLNNTTGVVNVATGGEGLHSNTTGHRNTATGYQSMYFNTEGFRNTATGMAALQSNTTGNFNTTFGWASLSGNTTGNDNTALGFGAGWNLTTGDNNIDVGNLGVAAESNTIRLGMQVEAISGGFVFPAHTATYIAGIYGTTVSRGATVFVDSNGRLGTRSSSQRFKDEIRPMDAASEAILALKPVTFRYKKELDPDGTLQFGLVAEDVEKVNPDLVARDADGKVYTVRYEAVNAMLLNEFLKAHQRIEEQDKRIDQLTAQLKQQAALIQKVNDKVELNRSAPQTVLNKQP